jgi:hypothetical protein
MQLGCFNRFGAEDRRLQPLPRSPSRTGTKPAAVRTVQFDCHFICFCTDRRRLASLSCVCIFIRAVLCSKSKHLYCICAVLTVVLFVFGFFG